MSTPDTAEPFAPLSLGGPGAPAPAGWRWAKLADLARLESGHTPSRNQPEWWGGDIPWLALPDIRALDGRVATRTTEYTNKLGIANSSARILPAGTVVLSRTASVGFVTIMGTPMATSQDFVAWVCGPDLDPRFLSILLRASREQIRALASGAVHKTVYVPTVQAFFVCVPGIAVQRELAQRTHEEFSLMERARDGVRHQCDCADALHASLLRDAFVSITPIRSGSPDGSTPPGWSWKQITSVARLESGHTPSRQHPEWWGGDVPWLALPDIRALDGKLAYETTEYTNDLGIANSSARILPPQTVVMSRTASVGFVTIMGRHMATSQDFVNWVCGPELDPFFLAYALRASRDYIRGLASGAVHKTIYMPTLHSLQVRMPPIAEQRRIVAGLNARFAEADRLRTALTARLKQIEALPATILRSVFTPAQGVGAPISELAVAEFPELMHA